MVLALWVRSSYSKYSRQMSTSGLMARRSRHLPNSFRTSTSVDRILVSHTVSLFSALGAVLSLLAYH